MHISTIDVFALRDEPKSYWGWLYENLPATYRDD